MYQIDIITIFPNLFDNFLNTSIIKRAQNEKKITFVVHDLRTYTTDKHRKVDDEAYGGGAGMVLKPEPAIRAVRHLKQKKTKVILLSPQGSVFNQKRAKEYAVNAKHLIFVCGRYEGFDERIYSVIDEELSIGDFVLNGGEIPAMVVSEAIVRLLPDVLNSKESYIKDSFYNNRYLDYPHYTRPLEFEGMKVPDVLTSGDHKKIATWRKKQAMINTYKKRRDLLTDKEIQKIERYKELD